MGQASTQRRAGRPRRTATAAVRASQPVCHLCGLPVDLTLQRTGRGKHPLSSCIDEIVPVIRGGSITDPANLGHAHSVCNNSRGTHPLVPRDPGWPQRTKDPEEVRARCRHLAQHYMAPTEPVLRPW